ncbi:MAG TPA: hypothetical protein VMB03_24920 [Bryobacteraceae bacterium]|nr:hypothetical protein [Bryobacteraceae bacterium]
MLNAWFYAHKTWQIGIVVDLTIVVVLLAGLFAFHRWIAWEHREHDTAMVGLSYALCGSVYAVILALVAGNTFETMEKSKSIASEEANSLTALIFDSAGLDSATANQVRRESNTYLAVVTKKEWPLQRAYKMDTSNFEEGWAILRRISVDLASFEPKSEGQATVKLEMEHDINDLFTARRMRLLAASQHVPAAVWTMLIFGLAMIAVYIYLFGPHSFKIHIAVTVLTALSVGFVFTLVIAEDYPFRGIVSVSSEDYVSVQEVAQHVLHTGTTEAPAAHSDASTEER